MQELLGVQRVRPNEDFDGKMVCLESRIGTRLDEHDGHFKRLDEHNTDQDGKIDDLAGRMAKLESMISSKMQNFSASTRPTCDIEKEAFLGGFANLPKSKLKEKAKLFVGDPTGLNGIDSPGNIGTFTFIKFDTPEQMETFVIDNKQRAEADGLRLKRNQPQGSLEEKTRRSTIWKGRQALIRALELPTDTDRVIFSRRRFWHVAPDGESLMEMGVLSGDDKIDWKDLAPEALRQV